MLTLWASPAACTVDAGGAPIKTKAMSPAPSLLTQDLLIQDLLIQDLLIQDLLIQDLLIQDLLIQDLLIQDLLIQGLLIQVLGVIANPHFDVTGLKPQSIA